MMETIDDIVRSMRDLESVLADKESKGSDIKSVWSIVSTLADRIEAAAKNTCEYASSAYYDSGVMLSCPITRAWADREDHYLEENTRLRAALKPVLECKKVYKPYLGQLEVMSLQWTAEPETAIAEAQRIYNESEVK